MRRQVFLFRGGGSPPRELVVEERGPELAIAFGGKLDRLRAARLPDGRISLLFEDGRQFCGRGLPRDPGTVEISTRRGSRSIALAEPLRDRLAHSTEASEGGESRQEIRSLMPGRVVDVSVEPGDRVEAGKLLLVLEAMKMQNEIRAERGGRVTQVRVVAGEAVEGGAVLLALEVSG